MINRIPKPHLEEEDFDVVNDEVVGVDGVVVTWWLPPPDACGASPANIFTLTHSSVECVSEPVSIGPFGVQGFSPPAKPSSRFVLATSSSSLGCFNNFHNEVNHWQEVKSGVRACVRAVILRSVPTDTRLGFGRFGYDCGHRWNCERFLGGETLPGRNGS